ncbi:MAG: zinc ribbon domain-containing protein [Candidatus Methylomirabilales bacterium]
MPIYEYDCGDCRRQVSLLILNINNPPPLRCPRCGGENLTRLLSRFTRIRSEEERLEQLADPSRLGDVDENDPQSVRRWMKRMGKELGEDAEDFEPMMEEALSEERDGETPLDD